MVEKLVEIGILYDFYGKLLSKRQYQAIELYYIHDLSLSEIGDELNITRQGIFDAIKRAELKLYEYEEKLGLVEKFSSSHENIKMIISLTDEVIARSKKTNDKIILVKATNIKDIGNKILEDSREVVEE